MGAPIGLGDGTFQSQTTLLSRPNSNPSSIAIGDYNGDLRKDIAVMNDGTQSVDMMLGDGKGTFTPQTDVGFRFAMAPFLVSAGDFNNDRRSEIVVAYEDHDNVDVLRAYDTGSFRRPMPYSTRTGPQSVAVGDFNNDSRLDIVVANSADKSVSVLLGNGSGSFANQIPYGTGSSPQSVAVGDFNRDSRLDIVVSTFLSNAVGILLGYANEGFMYQTMLTTGNVSRPRSFAMADFNNDSRMDVVVANSAAENIGIFIGFGNVSFANQVTYSTGLHSSPCSVAVADFNNDTSLDILVANYDGSNQGIFLAYGNGTFANFLIVATDYGSHPFSVVVGDFNGDRKMDFAVANNGTDSLSILLQTC